MSSKSTRKSRPHLLSSTRPKHLKSAPSLSSRTTRATIRGHHTLRKQLSSAIAKGNDVEAQRVRTKIEELGGIGRYQQASIQGQSPQRGGDTSKVLVEWLSDVALCSVGDGEHRRKWRLLEVGALGINNACSRCGLFDVERIDLHSQHPDIKEQDFMKRPIASAEDVEQEGFDIVSLSLVVNFVGDPAERGEMLKRVEAFLRTSANDQVKLYPALFLVLPAPCVTNSRYLDEDRLENIMKSLGYRKAKHKTSAKLVYYLWTYQKAKDMNHELFKKEVVRPGKSRNNFAISLR